MDQQDLIQVARSKVLTKLWYGIPLWLSPSITTKKDLRLIDAIVGNLLRTILKDFEHKLKRQKMHAITNIPTSINWSNYMMARTINKICTSEKPDDIFQDFLLQTTANDDRTRQQHTIILQDNLLKIGFNSIINRAAVLMRENGIDLTIPQTKPTIKKFFLMFTD